MKEEMGGLRKSMPITFWTFMIGTLALAGIFPLAGFWSKDEILATASQSGLQVFMVIGLIGAVLTAAYMTRCVYLTFFGEYRGHHHPHESRARRSRSRSIILAVLSVVAGFAQRGAVPHREVQQVGRARSGRSPSSSTPTSTTCSRRPR